MRVRSCAGSYCCCCSGGQRCANFVCMLAVSGGSLGLPLVVGHPFSHPCLSLFLLPPSPSPSPPPAHSPLASERHHVLRVAAAHVQLFVFCRGHVQRIDQQVDARNGPSHARLATHRLALFTAGAHVDPSQCHCRVFELVRAYTRTSCAQSGTRAKRKAMCMMMCFPLRCVWYVEFAFLCTHKHSHAHTHTHAQAGHEILSTLGAVSQRCVCMCLGVISWHCSQHLSLLSVHLHDLVAFSSHVLCFVS
jgi:hypothetical protein